METKTRNRGSTNKNLQKSASNLPANFDMSQLAGAGAEEIGVEDLPRPSLKLLQLLSPEVIVGKEEFMSNAKAGMFLNGSTKSLYTGSKEPLEGDLKQLVIIPVKYVRREVEFGKDRGGFKGEHLPGSEITEGVKVVEDSDGKRHRITTQDTELVDCSIFYCLVIDPEETEPLQVVISLSSSGKKFAKNWNAYMKGLREEGPQGKFNPAMFSRVYTIYSNLVDDGKGPYYVWLHKLNQVLDIKDEYHRGLIGAGLSYLELINNDLVKVDHENVN